MKRSHNTQDGKTVRLHLPERVWSELESEAAKNYRALNAEIAVRVLESLPSDHP